MGTVFEQKESFAKSYAIINTKEDYDMDVEYQFAMWSDPSRRVLSDLFDVVTTKQEELNEMSKEEKEELNGRFYAGVSSVIVDCNIAELDFSTPEAAEKSFDHRDVDANLMYDVIVRYITDIMEKSRLLKKS